MSCAEELCSIICKIFKLTLRLEFDQKLRFNSHIEFTIDKAKTVVSFIKRWSSEFDDPYEKVIYKFSEANAGICACCAAYFL